MNAEKTWPQKKPPKGLMCDWLLGVGYAPVGKAPVNGLTVCDAGVLNTSVGLCVCVLSAEQSLAALLFLLDVLQDGHWIAPRLPEVPLHTSDRIA